MVAYTTTYNLKKPTVADDEDVWGGYLNDSMDIIDDVLDGTVPVTGIDINSGTLDNVVIGGTTANSGTFTVLSATTSLGVTGNITVSGTVDGRDVAADGTKLDGIESGATADQTKADIDALGIAASTAATLATARNIALTGAVTGNVNFDGSGNVSITTTATSDPVITLTGAVTGSGTMTNLGNVSIATTATADPTLTLSGDASGSATFTNLGNATLSVTVADDSHNHVISNVDGLQTALDNKVQKGVGYEWTATGGNALSFRSLDTLETASGDQAALEIYQDTSGADAFMQFHVGGDYAAYFGLKGDINDFAVGGWSMGANYYRVWHAGNDGAGSGLDADNLDGYTWASSGKNVRAADFYADNWFRNYNSGEGLYNEANGMHFVSSNNSSYNVYSNQTSSRLNIATSGNAVRGALYGNTSNEIGILDSDQNWAIKHVRDSRTEWYINNTEYMELNANGLYLHDASLKEDYDALSGTSVTCNTGSAGAFSLTMTGNTTFTFSSLDSGYSQGFVLQLTGNGSTVTWPSSVDWAGGTAPDAPASGETDIYVFWTRDGGTTWYGVQSIDAAA